jgi:hypothetical protein
MREMRAFNILVGKRERKRRPKRSGLIPQY